MRNFRKARLLAVFMCLVLTAGAQKIDRWKVADLQKAIDTAQRPTIINFWATFCIPCIQEIPHFQELVKKYKSAGINLVLVNLDMKSAYPTQIASFAKKRKFTSKIVFLDETNADLFCPVADSSWSGALPSTLMLYPKNGYRAFFEMPLSREKLEVEIRKMLQYK
jgi:thiol-disulfide isomerase/thioredoxin